MTDPLRFLSSLTVAFDQRRAHLAVTEKGRVDAEFVAVTRYAMFSEVYWHHTVRSFTAMLRRAFHQASQWPDGALTITELLLSSDDQTLHNLETRAVRMGREDVTELLQHLRARQPYQCVFTLRQDTYQTLYQRLTSDRLSFMRGEKWDIDNELCKSVLGLTGLKRHHVLWDIPKPGKDSLSDVRIAKLDGTISAPTPGPLWNSLAGNFEKWVRKIRLFIHPEFRLLETNLAKMGSRFQEQLATKLGL